MLKGTAAVSSQAIMADPTPRCWQRFGAFLGHLFPVWLKFRGGKGVAVYIGVLIGLFWPAADGVLRAVGATAATRATHRCRRWSLSFVTPIFLWCSAISPWLPVCRADHAAVLHAPRKHQAGCRRAPRDGSARS